MTGTLNSLHSQHGYPLEFWSRSFCNLATKVVLTGMPVSLRLGGNARYSSRRTMLSLVSLLQLIFCLC